MKKRVMSIALTALLCLGLMLALTACDDGAVSMEGKWIMTEQNLDGETTSRDEFKAQLAEAYAEAGLEFNSEEFLYFEFKKDGTLTFVRHVDPVSGTYTLTGKDLMMVIDGIEQAALLRDGKTFSMVSELEGSVMSLTFAKQ